MRQLVAEPYEPGDKGHTNYAGGGYSAPTITADLLTDVVYLSQAQTAPSVDPFATQLGIHIECDTLGSRTTSSK